MTRPEITQNEYRKTKGGRTFSHWRRFWRVWGFVALGVAIVWAIVLFAVNGLLAEHDSVQPQYVAQRVFEEHFASKRVDVLAGYSKGKLSEFEDRDMLAEYVSRTYSDRDWSYSPAISTVTDELRYIVLAGEDKIAEFTLVKGDSVTDKLKLNYYKLGSVQFVLKPHTGVNVYAPLNFTVLVNGVAVSENYRSGAPSLLDGYDFLPDDETSRSMQNYYIDGLFDDPQVTVVSRTDPDVALELEYDKEKHAYSAEVSYLKYLAEQYADDLAAAEEREKIKAEGADEAIAALYGNFIVSGFKAYSNYMDGVKGATKNAAAAYFVSGYKINRSQWLEDYSASVEYSDIELSDCTVAQDGTYITCRLRITERLTSKKNGTTETVTVHHDKTIRLNVSTQSGCKIAEMANRTAD